MKNFYRYYFLFVAQLLLLNLTLAQNEFYLNGTDAVYNNGALIFVNGSITNNDASFTNKTSGIYTGTIELNGDWTNSVSSGKYVSNGIERFSGNQNQIISGTWNGTFNNENQFYALKINKQAGYVSLAQQVNIHKTGSIDFESTGGIIRTALNSLPNSGDYSYYIYLQNPSPNAITNYSWPSGTSRYIEGKLKRQVDTLSTYRFPIGFQPSVKDGMEPFEIKFNTRPLNTGILGYIKPATTNILTQTVLCDIGTDPGIGIQQFTSCTGPADGIYDLYNLDQNLSHEWMATCDTSASFNYDITFFPGTALDNLNYYTIPAACDGAYSGKRIRVYTNNGVVGGSEQPGIGHYAPFSNLSSFIWCDFDHNTLSNQTSFSAYRIYGTSQSTYTVLPVELISFTISTVENTYFQLHWSTATELNNAGFEIQRSEDAHDFNTIGFVAGNGTTLVPHAYQFDDRNVITDKYYYYRLKQKNVDGTYHYSYVVNGKLLNAGKEFSISDIYPNPAEDKSNIDIVTPKATTVEVIIMNPLGQQLGTNLYDLNEGRNTIPINMNPFASGTYLCAIRYGQNTYTKKFVKK